MEQLHFHVNERGFLVNFHDRSDDLVLCSHTQIKLTRLRLFNRLTQMLKNNDDLIELV